MAIRIFVTGGTFDKEYDEIRGRLYFRDSHLAEMLRMGRNRADVQIRTLMMVDSLEMSDGDRDLIARNCRDVPEDRIVITHGTDTMLTTALALAGIPGKTIVLTGSMQPARFHATDAVFNVASAITAVQILPQGVYIAMNGRIFDPRRTRKNLQLNRFEEL